MTIGEVVQKYRKNNKLSMDEFAKRCGLSKGYISMIEKGKHPQNERNLIPTIETLAKIAKGMNTDIDTLVNVLDFSTMITVNKKHPQSTFTFLDAIPEEISILQSAWDRMSEEDHAIIRIIADKYR